MIRKTELLGILVDLTHACDTSLLSANRALPAEICTPADRHVVRRAAELLGAIRARFSYLDSPAFRRSIQGKSSAYAAMRSRLEDEPARRTAHLQGFDSALRMLLQSREVYDLLASDAHADLDALEATLRGLTNPD